VFTLTTLVPINNRLAADGPGSNREGWRAEHVRWDMVHRWRIVLLIAATACLIDGILA
jgi:hypothetical protein